MNTSINMLRFLRAIINRLLKPASNYVLKPASKKYGFDRGTPIDRYYIEKFLEENKSLVKGTGLEITDTTYLKKYGGAKMERCDGLDINYKNKKASIYGDLRNLKKIIPANRYDVIILTQILGMIDDVASAIGECYRILKPGGWLIGTSAYLSPYIEPKQNYWRFTTTGIHYLLNKFFEQEKIRVGSYGNVLAGQAFWVGLAQEDLRLKDLEYNDPHYPLIIAFKAQK